MTTLVVNREQLGQGGAALIVSIDIPSAMKKNEIWYQGRNPMENVLTAPFRLLGRHLGGYKDAPLFR